MIARPSIKIPKAKQWGRAISAEMCCFKHQSKVSQRRAQRDGARIGSTGSKHTALTII